MKIAVITHGDENMELWKQNSYPNKQKYCDKHGYDFICSGKKYTKRPPAWYKILLVKRYLKDYDWIFWTDPDSLVINSDVKLESFIDESKSLIVSHSGLTVNAGCFFIKNTAWSNQFLNDVWESTNCINHPWWETKAFMQLLESKYLNDYNIRIDMNADYNLFPDYYKPNGFIVHWAGEYKYPNVLHAVKNIYPKFAGI